MAFASLNARVAPDALAWLDADAALDAPWFKPWRALIDAIGLPTQTDWLTRANTMSGALKLRAFSGQPLQFVSPAHALDPTKAIDFAEASDRAKAFDPADTIKPALPSYEELVAQRGWVLTRVQGEQAWHDYFNALVWLRFPKIKAAINQRQVQQIEQHGHSNRRGAVRDALTLFDESGVVFASSDSAQVQALQSFDWQDLFVTNRKRFVASTECVIVGHALLQKLLRPYKSICGQALVLQAHSDHAQFDEQAAAAVLGPNFSKTSLTPLPILGIPNWCAQNADPAFYNDPTVFRRGRR